MKIGSNDTLPQLFTKIADRIREKGIEVVMNEDSGVCMVRTPDLEVARLIVVEQVKCHGVRVDASPGRSFSTIKMTVPRGTDEEVAAFRF